MTTATRSPADILRERARALAQVPAAATPATARLEVLEFRLAQENWAVETRFVREVCVLKELTPLPGTPVWLRGIVNIRGRIVPVYDLKKLFDLPEQGITDLHRIVLVQGSDLELGLLVDLTTGVYELPAESLQSSLPTLSGIRSDYLKGVTADRLVVLDLGRILADPKLVIADES